MLTDKANTICLLEILKEYSDGDNILKMSDITAKMKAVYGITIDRRTVYGSIDLLLQLGYDISTYEENGKGYYLRTRDFELSEIHLLMESVYSNAAIPRKQTEDLIRKIRQCMSVHKRKEYRHLTVVHDENKTPNKEVFLNIELLDEAIAGEKEIEFVYLQYDFDKKLQPKRKRTYQVSPYAMVSANEHFYLICMSNHFNNIGQYRIDKMKDIKITDKAAKAAPADFNVRKHTQSAVYMFSQNVEQITLKCDNGILDHVIDKFGQGVRVSQNGDGTFTATVTASSDGIKFWALQYLERVEIIAPEAVRRDVIAILGRNKYKV